MAVESSIDGLAKLLEGLTIAVEKNPEDVSGLLDLLVTHVQEKKNDHIDSTLLAHLQRLLNWESKEIVAKSAKIISELAKTNAGREKCGNLQLLSLLIKFLASKDDIHVLIQVCRALGNICYENDKARHLVLDTDCLPVLLQVLENSLLVPESDGGILRNVSAGFLLNLLSGSEDVQRKAVDLGVINILCQVLEIDGLNSNGEEACTHVLLILGLLVDSAVVKGALLDERLCKVAVQVLGASQSPDVSEMCLELLYSQAEYEHVKVHLANAGLCELLIKLLEKHKPQIDVDDEIRNLMKMACDLIALVLTGDESMNILYADGLGEVFHSMVSWLSSDDEDLQITGVLAMGNFARTDKHCIQMVEAGVSKKLLTLVEKTNTPDGEIRLQHALLSALRNLVIPNQNKAVVLSNGLVNAVLPMLAIPTFPVVFKLLGTLRMVIDGQEEAARDLGRRHDLVNRLVRWCDTEDHPGVQGEANRLLAWLIKNSRDKEVLNVMLEEKAIPCMVKMMAGEHAVMQNEAVLALVLTVTIRPDSVHSFCDYDVGSNLYKLINDYGSSLAPEVLSNVLFLLENLISDGDVKSHIIEKNIGLTLKPLLKEKRFCTIIEKLNHIVTTLDSG